MAEVVKEGYPDHTQYDAEAKYYDPKADPDNPRWYMVDIKLKQKFTQILSLKDIKAMQDITEIGLIRKGMRLSIMPVTKREYELLLSRCR